MDAKSIVDSLLKEDAYSAQDAIRNILYCKSGDALRDLAPQTAREEFREENAVPLEECDACGCSTTVEAEQSPEQKAYRALFDRILKKHGVDSPNDLPDDKKDDFFNEVEREWKKDPANDNEGEGEELDEVGYMGHRPGMGGNRRTGMTRAKQL